MLGRKHRGESVKTGQEQGVTIDDGLLSLLMWARVQDAVPSETAAGVGAGGGAPAPKTKGPRAG